jgi:hypothetical protein
VIYTESRRSAAIVLVLLFLVGLSLSAAAVPATVLTNKGQLTDGTLTGIGPVIRLSAPDEVSIIGPDQQYDVPVSSLIQVTFDFPRVVIEATDRVLIGPYSAFRGIDEAVQVQRSDGSLVTIPTSSLRAIAFSGHALRAVPREWMGDRYLSEPEIVAASLLTLESGCEDCSITPPQGVESVNSGETVIWNAIEPQVPLEEESTGFPPWLALVAFGALVLIASLVMGRVASD